MHLEHAQFEQSLVRAGAEQSHNERLYSVHVYIHLYVYRWTDCVTKNYRFTFYTAIVYINVILLIGRKHSYWFR